MTLDIEDILSQLTLDEKVRLISGKDFWHTHDVERLGVPSIRVSDGPNGVRGTKFFNGVASGCFPNATGLAATFDKALLYKAGELMAQEAKAKAAHVILGPTMNIQRGPLGGRGFESFSEDPILSGLSAAAIVNGIEDNGISTTMKHFVCNDLEDERNSINIVVSERALRETYLYPFQVALKESKPSAFMTAYNKVNGEHVSSSQKILKQILREEWGFDGMVMSDWFGVYDLKDAIKNGLDLEMPGPPKMRKYDAVGHAVSCNEIHIKDLDDRVRNVLKLVKRAVEKSGIPKGSPETASNDNPTTAALLRKIAQDAIVLLKNESNVLPLKKTDKIAVLGPNALEARIHGGGSASMKSYYAITPFEGIKEKLGTTPEFSIGSFAYKTLPRMDKVIFTEDGKPGCSAKIYLEPSSETNRTLVDEIHLERTRAFMIDYHNPQIKNDYYFLDITGYFTPTQSGTYIFGVSVYGQAELFIDDELVVDNKTNQTRGSSFVGAGSIEEKGKKYLEKGNKYKITFLVGSGKTSPVFASDSGFAGTGFEFGCAIEKTADELIAEAVEVAKDVDKVIICIGTNADFESEGYDRPHMKLPGTQAELVSAVAKVNPNVVVVNQSGTPVELPFIKEIPCLVHAWFGGNECGRAMADILFGDVNPSGKLSLTFPIRNEDNPAFLNFKSNNYQCVYGEDIYVGYKYYEKVDRPVAFPFGYGLSYTFFNFSDAVVELSEFEIVASIKVTNTGDFDGAEVAQLYIKPRFTPNVTRPVKELKAYEKVFLKAGESKEVIIKTSIKYATSYYDEYRDDWCSEAGTYEVLIGNSSDNILVDGEIELTETTHWKGL